MSKYVIPRIDEPIMMPNGTMSLSWYLYLTQGGSGGGGGGGGDKNAFRPPMLSFMWSDHELNDMQWLRADTFSWQPEGAYDAAYQHLVDDCEVAYAYRNSESTVCWLRTRTPQVGDSVYNNWQYTTEPIATIEAYDESTQTITLSGVWPGGEPKTFTRYPNSDKLGVMSSETISGTTVQFFLADDGHKICPSSEETNVATIYNATGVAWYYIIDTTNERFKLPRTKFGFTGLRTNVGDYVAPGLPDHTHTQVYLDVNYKAPYGSNNRVCWEGTYVVTTNTGTASANNPIYGASTTVQPPATEMYLYFYVGQFVQAARENTAGLNTELFNDKADIDLVNVSATGKALAVGWGLPDYTAGVSISSGYVATQKCWLHAYTSGDGANKQSGEAIVYVNNVRVVGARVTSWSYQTINEIMVPLDVGDVVTSYALRGTVDIKIFPMKGL